MLDDPRRVSGSLGKLDCSGNASEEDTEELYRFLFSCYGIEGITLDVTAQVLLTERILEFFFGWAANSPQWFETTKTAQSDFVCVTEPPTKLLHGRSFCTSPGGLGSQNIKECPFNLLL
eukprot:scaffold6861_cov148-Amphora_coffeaeformis.AAC.2